VPVPFELQAVPEYQVALLFVQVEAVVEFFLVVVLLI